MNTYTQIPITDISVNPYQPRQHFNQEKLEELAQSIRENGVIQPLIVRPSSIVGYELLAGERRLRASQLAGLRQVPVVIKDLSDEEMLQQAIIENLQRADLNPIEEARSYQRLSERGQTHEEIAKVMGKSRPYITNLLRLLHLSPIVIEAVESNDISQAHARLLLKFEAEADQEAWLDKIMAEQMSVRELERQLSHQKKKTSRKPVKSDLFVQEAERQLKQKLGTPVSIQKNKKGAGQLHISFASLEEFERIINSFK